MIDDRNQSWEGTKVCQETVPVWEKDAESLDAMSGGRVLNKCVRGLGDKGEL